jgi:cellulose synthase/poly-beta-1,6-N-acetylglucosamine synthase-like glycosyltransferase
MYFWGWIKALGLTNKLNQGHHKNYTILIPYRNPTAQLTQIIETLTQESNPFVEIMLIDDFSESPFSGNIQGVTYLSLCNAHPELSSRTNNKKQAIEYGVDKSKGDFILCLDADISLPPEWLSNTISAVETYDPKFLAGIHGYHGAENFLSDFLGLEHEVLVSISASSLYWGIPTMCNGANMGFDRSAFYEVGGYEGTFDIVGGDDMLLMHRIFQKFPKKVFYNLNQKSAVYSEAPRTIGQLKKQRIRWLSKTFSYENPFVLPQMALIFISNLVAVSSLLMGLFQPYFFAIYMAKCSIDIVYNKAIQQAMDGKRSIKTIVVAAMIYPFYSMWIVANSINFSFPEKKSNQKTT